MVDGQYRGSSLWVEAVVLCGSLGRARMLRRAQEIRVVRELEGHSKSRWGVQGETLFLDAFRKAVRNQDSQFSEYFTNFLKVKYLEELTDKLVAPDPQYRQHHSPQRLSI